MGLFRGSVEKLHISADEIGDFQAAFDKPPKPALDHLLFPLPFGYTVGNGFGAFGQVFQCGHDAFQFLQVFGVGRQGRLEFLQAVA